MLVCMFLWLFEQFDNQHTRALFHRDSATKLMGEWRTRERGLDRIMDDYITSYLEPAFLTGFKVTAPVKLCREVLSALRLLRNGAIDDSKTCTYNEALNSLGTCAHSFVTQAAKELPFKIRTAFASLRMWDYQFQHYSGLNWPTEGRLLLSYATSVAMLVQITNLVKNSKDADWHRAADFLIEETSKIRHDLEDKVAHRSLLKAVTLITSR